MVVPCEYCNVVSLVMVKTFYNDFLCVVDFSTLLSTQK